MHALAAVRYTIDNLLSEKSKLIDF